MTVVKPVNEDYRDVKDNIMKLEGKILANVQLDYTKQQLELLITTKKTHALLGLDWMGKLGTSLESDKINANMNHINNNINSENTLDRNIAPLKLTFNKLFTENQTVKNLEVDNQSKDKAKFVQQKCSIHF